MSKLHDLSRARGRSMYGDYHSCARTVPVVSSRDEGSDVHGRAVLLRMRLRLSVVLPSALRSDPNLYRATHLLMTDLSRVFRLRTPEGDGVCGRLVRPVLPRQSTRRSLGLAFV